MVIFLFFERTSQNDRALIIWQQLLTPPLSNLSPRLLQIADKAMVCQFHSPPSNEQSKGIGVMHPLCSALAVPLESSGTPWCVYARSTVALIIRLNQLAAQTFSQCLQTIGTV